MRKNLKQLLILSLVMLTLLWVGKVISLFFIKSQSSYEFVWENNKVFGPVKVNFKRNVDIKFIGSVKDFKNYVKKYASDSNKDTAWYSAPIQGGIVHHLPNNQVIYIHKAGTVIPVIQKRKRNDKFVVVLDTNSFFCKGNIHLCWNLGKAPLNPEDYGICYSENN